MSSANRKSHSFSPSEGVLKKIESYLNFGERYGLVVRIPPDQHFFDAQFRELDSRSLQDSSSLLANILDIEEQLRCEHRSNPEV